MPKTYLKRLQTGPALAFPTYQITRVPDNPRTGLADCDCHIAHRAIGQVLPGPQLAPVAAEALSNRLHSLYCVDEPDALKPELEVPHGYPTMNYCMLCDVIFVHEMYRHACTRCQGTGTIAATDTPCVCGPDHLEPIELCASIDFAFPRPTILAAPPVNQAPHRPSEAVSVNSSPGDIDGTRPGAGGSGSEGTRPAHLASNFNDQADGSGDKPPSNCCVIS